MAGKTLYDKLWDAHLVAEREDGSASVSYTHLTLPTSDLV